MLPQESIFITGLNPDVTLAIVKELRAFGLIQGRDFEFRYQKQEYVNGNWTEGTVPGGAEFYFKEGKWRTYLALKYAN